MENYNIEKYNEGFEETSLQNSFELEDAYLRAKKRVDKIKGFYGHLFWYVVVNVFLLSMIYYRLDNGDTLWEYKHFSTAFFWGIGLFFHFLGTFGTNILFGKAWEEKQIEKYMNKNKDKKRWE